MGFAACGQGLCTALSGLWGGEGLDVPRDRWVRVYGQDPKAMTTPINTNEYDQVSLR